MSHGTTRLALGSTGIILVYARPLSHLAAGIVVPGNMRGVMAAGLAGEVRVRAGRSIEDELLQHRPFSLGNAYPTGAGRLQSDGVEVLAHAITSTEPGDTPKATHAERAVRAALALLDNQGARTATLPLIETTSGNADAKGQGRAFAALVAGHLRRRSRLRQVTIAGLDRDFLSGVHDYLSEQGAHRVED